VDHEGVGMNAFERYDLVYGSPADEAPEYEITDDDIISAFECASELECDISCDLEKAQPDAYLNDDPESLAALANWLDAISALPRTQKLNVIATMRTLFWCSRAIETNLEAIENAAYCQRKTLRRIA